MKVNARHENPDAILDRILMERVQERARELAVRMNEWLAAPVSKYVPTDSAPAEVTEWCRSARDILELVGGITRG